MKVLSLSLKQFRNLNAVSLLPHPNLNLIVGLNASGKTNLCEALCFASRGQLLKGDRQREAIQWDQSWSTIKINTESHEIRIQLNDELLSKEIEVNDEAVTQRSVLEVLKVLVFTPDDLQLVKGGPSKRRHMMDRAIADIDPIYRRLVSIYEQVLRRKNALLKSDRGDQDLLRVYNGELVKHGAQIVEKRLAYLSAIAGALADFHRSLNQAHKPLALRYDSQIDYTENAARALSAGVEAELQQEQLRRQSLVGPHRDDVAFLIDGTDARRYGSQGQQKTALIALKLAQLHHFKQALDEYPVLILDDVLSELDPQRTQLLLDHLPQNIQVFLTATHLSDALRGRAGKVFCIDRGQVAEQTGEKLCA